MSQIITINNLRKSYPLPKQDRKNDQYSFEAVRGISFSVEQGEIFGILGPNGAGKTTTLEIIEGLNEQTSGEVVVLGLDNISEKGSIKKQIGVQLQSSDYVPQMTLEELLKLFGGLYGKTVDVDKLLGFVNLENKKHSLVKDLSGGQKQRISLARALIKNPQVVLFDDCLSAVDAETEETILQHLNSFLSDKTAIIITHRIFSLMSFDKILVLDNGRLAEQGTHDELLALQGIYHQLYQAQQLESREAN